MRYLRVLVPAVALLLTGACGVNSEDRPQPIENSTSQAPEATPSVDTDPGPLPPPPTSPTSTLSTTPTPTGTYRPADIGDETVPNREG
jgi:hypothetical protein